MTQAFRWTVLTMPSTNPWIRIVIADVHVEESPLGGSLHHLVMNVARHTVVLVYPTTQKFDLEGLGLGVISH